MPGIDPDLTIGGADQALIAELTQRFLIILGQLAKPARPPTLDAAKWTFHPLEVWFSRGGHLELAYPGGNFRMFIPAKDAAVFIETLRNADERTRVLVYVASEWRGASWRRIGIIGDDVLMLAYCAELDREESLAVLSPDDRLALIAGYDAYQRDCPAPTDAQAPAE